MAPVRKQILIVDDHALVRRGLAHLIGAETDLAVSGEADSAQAALRLLRTSSPALALVDLSLTDGSGLDLIQDIKREAPGVAVLVLSMHDESLYAERALRAGASGYIMKREMDGEVITAIRKVLSGGIYLSPRMQAKALQQFAAGRRPSPDSPLAGLSDRELEILELMGRGHGTREMASRLRLGVSTVETYRARLKNKLNLESGIALARYASQWVEGAPAQRRRVADPATEESCRAPTDTSGTLCDN